MASDIMTAVRTDDFRIGSVFSRAIGTFARHPLGFSLVAAVSQVGSLWPYASGGRHLTPGAISAIGIVAEAVSILTSAIISHASFQTMHGQPVRFGDSLGQAVQRFFPALGAMIILGVVSTIGFFLLVIPGIMVGVALSVILPVCVIEELGPTASAARSRRLTKGSRWKLFGTYLLLFVPFLVIGGLEFLLARSAGQTVAVPLNFIVQTILSAFTTILLTAAYHDLRVAREGLDTNRLAAVFD